jgi:hypothetical protein
LGRLTSDYNRDNLYKSHTITKQQYEQALAAKSKRQKVKCFTAAKATASEISYCSKSKPQINKLTLRLPISKSKSLA